MKHKDFCSHYVLGECSEEHHNICVGRNQCIKDLEQENSRLKEEVFKWQKEYSRQYQINDNKGYSQKEEQYKQALIEIKEIAEENKDTVQYGEICRSILQKFSEVME